MKRQKKTNHFQEVEKTLLELNVSYVGTHLFQWHHGNLPISVDNLIALILTHRNEKEENHIPKEIIVSHLMTKEYNIIRNITLKFRETIQYMPDLPDKFEELARLITQDKYEIWFPIILKHVIWTFKRRLFGLEDYCPIFLNFSGEAGCGKSEFVKSFTSVIPAPLKSSVAIASEVFDDERQSFRFVKNYVLTMDELAGMKDTDVCKLKNLIDSKVIVYRMLGYNKTCEGRNNAILIGTSNKEIKNIIYTDSDARKWVDIPFHSYPDREVPEKMVIPAQKFDWLTLYKSVNENGRSPFQDPEIYSNFRLWNTPRVTTETPSVIWLKELIQNEGGEFVSLRNAYEDYCNVVKVKQLSRANFKELLSKWGFQKSRTPNARGYIIPKPFECKFMDKEDCEIVSELRKSNLDITPIETDEEFDEALKEIMKENI